MSSNQEDDDQEAGPSGISREETLALLGLDLSDSEQEEENLSCHEVMEDSDDEVCNDVMDRFERQRAFQTQLLQQSGEGLDPQTPVGTFEFDLDPFVDRQSSRMGVRERHFNTRLRQTGNFVDSPHVVQALQGGLRRAVDRVLTTTPNLHDQDRLYFTLSSNRLTRNFKGGDYAPGNGEKEEPGWMPFSIAWLKPSTATNNLKWTIRFNCPSPKSTTLLGEVEENAIPNRVIKLSKS